MQQKYVSPLIMWAIILLGGIVFFWLVPKGAVLSPQTYSWTLVFPAVVYAVYFYITALGVNNIPAASVADVKQLITAGPYALVRHPLYSADIVLAWGLFFAFPSLRLLVAVIWATTIFVYWAKLEEAALEEKFGEQYREYRARVPMLFPRLRK